MNSMTIALFVPKSAMFIEFNGIYGISPEFHKMHQRSRILEYFMNLWPFRPRRGNNSISLIFHSI